MKLSITLVSLFAASAAAFAPSAKTTLSSSTKIGAAKNGFTPDDSKFCYGLPGAVAPFTGGFDPAGIADREDYETIKTFRESEVTHGRVAMLAVVGFLVTEQPLHFHPLFDTGIKDIGPAIRHLDEVRATAPSFFTFLTLAIGAAEIRRALIGWEVLTEKNLKTDYYPGDIGFDPLGLKPTDPVAFNKMQTKELQNGRLAMLASMGFILQEITNGKEIFVNLGLAPDTFDPTTLPIQFGF